MKRACLSCSFLHGIKMQKKETIELELHTVIFHITPKHSFIKESKVEQSFKNYIQKINDVYDSKMSHEDYLIHLKDVSSGYSEKRATQYIFNHDIDFNIEKLSLDEKQKLKLNYEILEITKTQDYENFKKTLKEKISYKKDNHYLFVKGEILTLSMYEDLQKIIESQNFKSTLIVENIVNKEINYKKNDQPFSEQVLQDIECIKEIIPLIKKTFNQKYIYVDNFENNEEKQVKFLQKNYIPWLKTKNILHQYQNKDFCFIGDSHEDVHTLKALIQKIDERNPHNILILIGDYLDKGNHTKEMIEYLFELKKNRTVLIIEGNHESFVYRRLTGQVEQLEGEDEIFSSLITLKKDEDLRQKFAELYLSSIPFLYFSKNEFKGFATHAPCHPKHLGKINQASLKNQRNFYFKERELTKMYQELHFMKDEKISDVLHIFGHIACEDYFMINNKYFIDSGSVYNNKLTAMIISDKIEFIQQNSFNHQYQKEIELFSSQDFIESVRKPKIAP